MSVRVVLLSLSMTFVASNAYVVAAQNLREVAREHARRSPGVPLEQPAPPGHYSPTTIEQVIRDADLVIQATLSRVRSYVPPSDDRVLTEYSMLAPQVISGSLPVERATKPGTVTAPLTLTVLGGEVTLEGVRVRTTDQNRDPIKNGAHYILVLQRARGEARAGHYEPYYGGIFEVVGERVRPLLKNADTVFKGGINPNLAEFVSLVRAVKGAR